MTTQNSKLRQIIRRALLNTIRLYQYTLSPDHGLLRAFFPFGVCRYKQTCSEYTYQAITQHGLRGLVMGGKRVLHCHPFAKV